MRVASVSLSYRIWRNDQWVDPADFLRDLDSYLRWIFDDCPCEHAPGGLLIEADGKAWNSHETFDTAYNMACWFTGAAELLQGRPEVFVWAWEECNCYLRKRGFLVELEERSHWVSYPTVRFPLRDFMRQLVAPGRLLLRLQRATAARIAVLDSQTSESGLPPAVARWAAELPPAHLAFRSAPARWQETRDFPLEEADLVALEQALETLERTFEPR